MGLLTRRNGLILISLIGLLVINPVLILHVFAHNNSNIVIPIAKHKITLDGQIKEEEWDDAFKTNFTSPRINEGFVLVFLKYELSKKALNGAFVIPDKTPVANIIESDQIGFLFDILHAASNSTGPTNHATVFIRDGRGEYYKGDRELQGGYRSIDNATIGEHRLNLQKPFSQADFTISNSRDGSGWQGEFSIYFQSDPELYGFAIQQIDYHVSSDQTLSHFINFPANHTEANIPSTWGDISYFGLKEYVSNIQKFCPKNPAIAPSNNMVLCATINPTSIEEKIPTKLNIIGSIGDLVNGSGIKDQIKADVINPEGYVVESTDTRARPDGSYRHTISDVVLDSGSYQVVVKPTNFSGLNTTAELVVNKHIPTIDESITQLGAYFGVIAGALGLAAFVPRLNSYLIAKKQRKNVYLLMNDIIKLNETNLHDKESYLEHLNHRPARRRTREPCRSRPASGCGHAARTRSRIAGRRIDTAARRDRRARHVHSGRLAPCCGSGASLPAPGGMPSLPFCMAAIRALA